MKLRLGQFEQVIKELQAVDSKKLPVRVHYAIRVNLRTLSEVWADYVRQRQEILEEKCVRNEKNEPVTKLNDNNVKEYTYNGNDKEETLKRVIELANIEEDITVNMLPLSELERCENEGYDTLTGKDIAALLFMVE